MRRLVAAGLILGGGFTALVGACRAVPIGRLSLDDASEPEKIGAAPLNPALADNGLYFARGAGSIVITQNPLATVFDAAVSSGTFTVQAAAGENTYKHDGGNGQDLHLGGGPPGLALDAGKNGNPGGIYFDIDDASVIAILDGGYLGPVSCNVVTMGLPLCPFNDIGSNTITSYLDAGGGLTYPSTVQLASYYNANEVANVPSIGFNEGANATSNPDLMLQDHGGELVICDGTSCADTFLDISRGALTWGTMAWTMYPLANALANSNNTSWTVVFTAIASGAATTPGANIYMSAQDGMQTSTAAGGGGGNISFRGGDGGTITSNSATGFAGDGGSVLEFGGTGGSDNVAKSGTGGAGGAVGGIGGTGGLGDAGGAGGAFDAFTGCGGAGGHSGVAGYNGPFLLDICNTNVLTWQVAPSYSNTALAEVDGGVMTLTAANLLDEVVTSYVATTLLDAGTIVFGDGGVKGLWHLTVNGWTLNGQNFILACGSAGPSYTITSFTRTMGSVYCDGANHISVEGF